MALGLWLPGGGSCSGPGQAAAAPDASAVKPAKNAAASAAALALDSGSMDMLGWSMLLSSPVPGICIRWALCIVKGSLVNRDQQMFNCAADIHRV